MSAQSTSILASMGRVGRAVALTVALAASLLTFPSAIPAMIACWLVVYTVAVARRRPGAGWLLAAPIFVVLVKRVDWPIGLAIFLAVAAAVALVSVCTPQLTQFRRR